MMSINKSYPAPWFKQYIAEYHRDTAGMTMEEKGIYLSLQVVYWENTNTLPPNVGKRIGIQESQQAILHELLASFFTDGKHLSLDGQREDLNDLSNRNATAARKRWAKPKPPKEGESNHPTVPNTQPQEPANEDPSDF